MLPHVSSVALADPSTSRQYWDNFTGYQYGNVLNFRWLFWCTRHWTACHHSTWRTTVNSSQPLAAGDFDRLMLLLATFHEPSQLWAIDPSLLLVHICGTIYHFIFVTLNYRLPSFWKRICLAEDRGANSDLLLDVVRLITCTYLFTYLSLKNEIIFTASNLSWDMTTRDESTREILCWTRGVL